MSRQDAGSAAGYSGSLKHLLVVCTAVASLLPVAAAAQRVGFQAGAAFDPKQIYVGSHIELPLGSDQIVIRPGISGAFGAGWRMAAIGGDFIYRFTLGGTGWRIQQGLGPSVNIARFMQSTIPIRPLTVFSGR